ncbi:hypothetical protein LTR48_005714 [Friedmanniomyces endolithicus]|nr:hypothetical protein LTR48_005714 [Friedmanniomyces endolithicus]
MRKSPKHHPLNYTKPVPKPDPQITKPHSLTVAGNSKAALRSVGVASAIRIEGNLPINGNSGAPVGEYVTSTRGRSSCSSGARCIIGEVYGGASSNPSPSYAGGS